MNKSLVRHGAEVALAVAIAMALVHCTEGCKPAQDPNEIAAAYAAEQLACVEQAKTRYEADVCRANVNRKYGLCDQVRWPNINPCDVGAWPGPEDAGGE